jgi:hypothetical protein
MLPPANQLTMRLTLIGGETRADDYVVIWNGFTIGRIMKQSGLPPGRPSWSWSIIFAHRPQLAWHKGQGRDLEEAKKLFKLAWSAVHRELTPSDLDAEIAEAKSTKDRPWNRHRTRFAFRGPRPM